MHFNMYSQLIHSSIIIFYPTTIKFCIKYSKSELKSKSELWTHTPCKVFRKLLMLKKHTYFPIVKFEEWPWFPGKLFNFYIFNSRFWISHCNQVCCFYFTTFIINITRENWENWRLCCFYCVWVDNIVCSYDYFEDFTGTILAIVGLAYWIITIAV